MLQAVMQPEIKDLQSLINSKTEEFNNAIKANKEFACLKAIYLEIKELKLQYQLQKKSLV